MFHHSLVNKSDEVVKAVTKPSIKKPSIPRDPDKIKQPPTSYIIFCSDQRKILQDQYPDLPFADLGRLMGEKWRQLDDPAKAPYIQKALEKRAEYEQAVRVQEQKRRESGDYSHTTESKASKTKRVKPEKPYMEMAEIQKREMSGTILQACQDSIGHSVPNHHQHPTVDNNGASVVVVPAISMHESELGSVERGAQDDDDDDDDDDNGDEEV